MKDTRGKVLGRTTFTPVGSESNGYLSCVLRPAPAAVSRHLGALQQAVAEGETELAQQRRRLRSREKLWMLRAGEVSMCFFSRLLSPHFTFISYLFICYLFNSLSYFFFNFLKFHFLSIL